MNRRKRARSLSEVERDPRSMMGQEMTMPSVLLSEILAGEEYEMPEMDMRMREDVGAEIAPIDRDYRGQGIEGGEGRPSTVEIPSMGIDFMPEGMEQRFRRSELPREAQEAFAFPVESGETSADARRRALEELKSAMTPEERQEFEIQKQNWLRKQRMR